VIFAQPRPNWHHPHQQSFQARASITLASSRMRHARLERGPAQATARDRPYYHGSAAAPVYSRGWACPCPGVGRATA